MIGSKHMLNRTSISSRSSQHRCSHATRAHRGRTASSALSAGPLRLPVRSIVLREAPQDAVIPAEAGQLVLQGRECIPPGGAQGVHACLPRQAQHLPQVLHRALVHLLNAEAESAGATVHQTEG